MSDGAKTASHYATSYLKQGLQIVKLILYN